MGGRGWRLGLPITVLIAYRTVGTGYTIQIQRKERNRGMRVTLKITGMRCTDCDVSIQKALATTPGVESATVSYLKKHAVVEVPEGVGIRSLVTAVEQAGYNAEPVSTGL